MTLNAYDSSAGVFLRGLTNLKAQLAKGEAHAGGDQAALLGAKLSESPSPHDLHGYTLAAQVHWACEGARLAIARLLDVSTMPAAPDAKTFADLHQRLDATIAQLKEVAPGALEAGLAREIVLQTRHGTTRSSGSQFLLGYGLPHFFYHLNAAYGILRNQGVPLTMADYLGNWTTR
jgi:hypothetical protein